MVCLQFYRLVYTICLTVDSETTEQLLLPTKVDPQDSAGHNHPACYHQKNDCDAGLWMVEHAYCEVENKHVI